MGEAEEKVTVAKKSSTKGFPRLLPTLQLPGENKA